jgi:hypothetical protein
MVLESECCLPGMNGIARKVTNLKVKFAVSYDS